MGDELRIQPGANVRFCCAVEGAQGCLLRICSAESEATVPIDHDHFSYGWQVHVDADTFFRAEVLAGPASDGLVIRALGNPIYVRVGR
jgi:hypothetical protein